MGVKGLIVNNDGKVLITQEPTHFFDGGKWELPGGKIAEGEEETPLEEILKREIREELGEAFRVEIGDMIDIMRRPWNNPGAAANQVMLVVFKCRYQEGKIELSFENNDFAWITAEELHQHEFVSGYLPVLEKYFKE